MRVLLVNKFWYPKGGSERYTFALKNLLESKGHEVIPFGMEDERNVPTQWAEHFVSHVDFWEAADAVPNQTSALARISRVLWSREAAQKIEEVIVEAKPDVAHLQNFAHQLSPSILPALARHSIPTIWTLHDYEALCPNYRMYTRGLPCERCKGHSYANAIRYRCMGSFGASAAVALEMAFHHIVLNVYGKHLAAVIAPSAFLATKLREWGWKGRIEMLSNFINPENAGIAALASGSLAMTSPVLFVGRLVEEKGIEDFVEAAKRLPMTPFEIVGGDNPSPPPLTLRGGAEPSSPPLTLRGGTLGGGNVRWLGALTPDETAKRIASAAMLVVPSRWYENAPYVVLEAMAAGVPVVASRIGGLPELVRDGETGVLVPPRNPETLARTIETLYHDGAARQRFGARARAIVAEEYGPERHYERLTNIYDELVNGRTSS